MDVSRHVDPYVIYIVKPKLTNYFNKVGSLSLTFLFKKYQLFKTH